MATTVKAFAVTLTIPDNEAFTALEALRRMGITVDEVRRADIWAFEVDEEAANDLVGTLATVETIYNPNKHRIEERAGARPAAGEVWVGTRDEAETVTVAGRTLAGVHAIHRRTAWRLLRAGHDVEPAALERAVTTFLSNPAFQEVVR
jgi:phosphoribosylformylglycinamidine (FGAM) synthase PurS component